MCKIAGATKVTDQNRQEVWVFMTMLGNLMTRGNNDGLGYAAFDKKGNLFGERWLINQTAFKDLSQIKGFNLSKLDKMYSFFGDKVLRNEAQAIVLHTRAATCARGIENVHPFVDDIDNPKVAIIHNGMIYNDKKFIKKYSTCDSEVIAHLYAENQVSNDLTKLSTFTSKMEGWYTVLALSKNKDGRMIMDAFTDTGRLGSYFIKELDTRIYSTSAEDIFQVAQSLGLTATHFEKLAVDKAFRIDVLTGEQIDKTEFKSDNSIPCTVVSNYEYWNNVSVMDGNLDDEEFKNKWFGWRNKMD